MAIINRSPKLEVVLTAGASSIHPDFQWSASDPSFVPQNDVGGMFAAQNPFGGGFGGGGAFGGGGRGGASVNYEDDDDVDDDHNDDDDDNESSHSQDTREGSTTKEKKKVEERKFNPKLVHVSKNLFTLMKEGKYQLIDQYRKLGLLKYLERPTNSGLTTLHECIIAQSGMEVRVYFTLLLFVGPKPPYIGHVI